MPHRLLIATLRGHISLWRLVLLVVVFYVVIRLAIPWLASAGIPFWARAGFLAMGPVLAVVLGPWLFPRRR